MKNNKRIMSLMVLNVLIVGCGQVPSALSSSVPSYECAEGYISIRGDRAYGTRNFCVMKFEASEREGAPLSAPGYKPWVNISESEAAAACQNLGAGYHLLTNNEWMTISTRAAAHSGNWTEGAVGSGGLMRGHAVASPEEACAASDDDQKAWLENDCTPLTRDAVAAETLALRRTLLVGHERIWDMSGNVWEWVSYGRGNLEKPTPDDNSWYEYNAITVTPQFPLHDFIPHDRHWWNAEWTNANGIGKYSGGSQGTGGAMIRGGGWYFAQSTGLFSASLKYEGSLKNPNLGFRCAYAQSPNPRQR